MKDFFSRFSPSEKFFAGVALQVIILLLIIFSRVMILMDGTDVFLKIMPVDPRSPFRGDYLTFKYEISDVDRSKLSFYPEYGKTVYVPLERAGKYFLTTWPVSDNPGKLSGITFIKGKIKTLNNEKVGIAYGIEQYYIPENAGESFDINAESYAVVTLDKRGNSVIKKIYSGDKPFP